MAIVLFPTTLCKGDTILVVPITNYTLNDEKHWDKIVLDNYNFLHKKTKTGIRVVWDRNYPYGLKTESLSLSLIGDC